MRMSALSVSLVALTTAVGAYGIESNQSAPPVGRCAFCPA